MTTDPSRRRILRFASAWCLLPLAFAARADDPLGLKRPRGEEQPPRDPGYGAPAGPGRPAPKEVRPPTPSPTGWPRREPGWQPARPSRHPKLPPRIPRKPGLTPSAPA